MRGARIIVKVYIDGDENCTSHYHIPLSDSLSLISPFFKERGPVKVLSRYPFAQSSSTEAHL